MDLLVVIVGITIAFGIDNRAEERKNEKLKQQYLISLPSDLRKDSLSLLKTHEVIQDYLVVVDVVLAKSRKVVCEKALDQLMIIQNLIGRELE